MQFVSWLKNWPAVTGRRKPNIQARTVVAFAEHLEVRALPSSSVLIVAGTELNITLSTNDNVSVSSLSGNVVVQIGSGGGQLQPVSIGTFPASSLQSIVITGGDAENNIDLSGVTSAEFTALTSISVDAGNGDDSILGSNDFGDSLVGGDGADTLDGQGGANTLDGGDGEDVIRGGTGIDIINGGDGADTIDAGAGNDNVDAGNGSDLVNLGVGDDVMNGQNGEDTINGGAGNDTINGDGGADLINGDDGNDSIIGGERNDTINGGLGADVIRGMSGNDSIDGQAGDDSLFGDGGQDRMQGGDGNDFENGGSGNDTIEGGNGNDSILGGSGNDVGFDDFELQANSFIGADTLNGQSGDDTLFGVGGPDLLIGGVGNDLLDTRVAGLVADDLIFNEGDVTNTVFMTVRLTVPSASTVTVDFTTFSDGTTPGGTAIVGSDYEMTNGTLTFLPGETVKLVPVVILGDTTIESDDTYFLNLSNPVNAQLNDPQAEGRMINDDIVPPPPVLDIVFLLDDTGSFQGTLPNLIPVFPTIVSQLQTQYPGGDFAFAISRFEDYSSATPFFDSNDKPFILNQPLITDDTPNFLTAINAALNRGKTGSGGSGPESAIEALFQIATGVGFDGNGDGDTVDAGPAGPASTQTNTGGGGDVPGYDTFVPDLTNNVLPPTIPVPTTPVDGVGFRPGTRRIVLLATDAPFTFQPDGLATYTGLGGVTVPANQVTQGGDAVSPGGRGAAIQNTINALLADSVQVVGLGDEFGFFGSTPRPQLTGLATLTGALNATATPIENLITPGPSADDIQPGDPLYFVIDPSNPVGFANAIVLGIVGAVGTATPPPPPPPPALPGPQADTLIGNDGNDTLLAADTDDIFNGSAGDDFIDAGAGNDSVLGGAGNDTIFGQFGNDTLNGQGGTDLLFGGDGDDTIVWDGAGGGNDTLSDPTGDNTLLINGTGDANTFTVGKNAEDQLVITESGKSVTVGANFNRVAINGNNGNDVITIGNLEDVAGVQVEVFGGNGNDVISAAGALIGNVRLELNGDAGNDTLAGSEDGDTITGGDGNDRLNGRGGNDTIIGGEGNDNVFGDAGSDSIQGNAGDDSLRGNDGHDSVDGGDGFDVLLGQDGDDSLNGGAGDDSLDGSIGADTLLGDLGLDTLTGGDGNDSLDGGVNDDSIIAGAGNDIVRGNHGHDSIDAGDGDDTVIAGDGNDTVIGGLGNDAINGSDGDDVINSGAGNDTVLGGDGNDILGGGGGADVILGGDGDDTINGQGGNDTVAGNEGVDTIADPANEIIEAFTLSNGLLTALEGI